MTAAWPCAATGVAVHGHGRAAAAMMGDRHGHARLAIDEFDHLARLAGEAEAILRIPGIAAAPFRAFAHQEGGGFGEDFGRGACRRRQQRILVALDEAGIDIAGEKIGMRQAADQEAALVRTPAICVSDSACASLAAAASRVSAQAMTLAIIGS